MSTPHDASAERTCLHKPWNELKALRKFADFLLSVLIFVINKTIVMTKWLEVLEYNYDTRLSVD